MRSDCTLFFASKKLIVCVIIFYFPCLLSEEGAYFTNGNILCHISFFVYTFCRLLWFSQILNMAIQDFQNIHSYHKITTEVYQFRLLWKLSKNIGFHRNYCKMKIVYGYVTQSWYILFKKKQSHLFIWYAQFFHFILFLLSKVVFYGVQKLKGKRVFRKIEIIPMRHKNKIQWSSAIQAVSWQCFPKCPIKNPESQALM